MTHPNITDNPKQLNTHLNIFFFNTPTHDHIHTLKKCVSFLYKYLSPTQIMRFYSLYTFDYILLRNNLSVEMSIRGNSTPEL